MNVLLTVDLTIDLCGIYYSKWICDIYVDVTLQVSFM